MLRESPFEDAGGIDKNANGGEQHLEAKSSAAALKSNRDSNNNKDLCWNGKDSAPYDTDIVEDGLTNQARNPEVSLTALVPPTVVKDQIYRLQTITNQLKQAYRGHNVEWWDTKDEDIGDGLMAADGSGGSIYEGSGYGTPCDDIDDEDCPYEGSGQAEASGLCGDDADCGDDIWPKPSERPKTPWKPWKPEEPRTEVPPEISTKISHPNGSGAGSFRIRRWNANKSFEMCTTIARFLLPAFATGLGWYITNGLPALSFYSSHSL